MVEIVRKKEGEASWITYIKRRIENDLNFICVIYGPPGSGKTQSAESIGEALDPEFNEERVVSSAIEMMALVNSGKLKKGSVVVWDEPQIDLSSRNWQSKTNKLINYLITTMRHRNWILIFSTPYADFVDSSIRKLFHAEFRCLSIDRTNKLCRLKPLNMEYNSHYQKFYYHRLLSTEVVEGVKKMHRISFWDIPKPSEELVEKVEVKKLAFTTKLNKEIEIGVNNAIETKQNRLITTPEVRYHKPLTDVQKAMVELAKKEKVTNKEMSKKLNIPLPTIYNNLKYLRNRGYFLENLAYSEKIGQNEPLQLNCR